jgi:hypothetical protein
LLNKKPTSVQVKAKTTLLYIFYRLCMLISINKKKTLKGLL